MPEDPLRLLALWVVQEREERFGSVEEAARRAGINRITWKRVESGLPVQDATYVAVNKVFGLKQGGHRAIMAGRVPELREEPDTTEPEPDASPRDPYVVDLQERYDLDPDGAEAAAVLIRALQRKRGNSPEQSKKQA